MCSASHSSGFIFYLSTIDHVNVNYLATYLPTLALFIIWELVFVVFKWNELKNPTEAVIYLFFF